MAVQSFQYRYPWTQFPVIVGAPMGLFIASPSFAVATRRSGGFGFLAAGQEKETMLKGLDEAKSLLAEAKVPLHDNMLPVGIGFLLFGSSLDGAAEAVQKYQPIAVWLFAAKELKDYVTWSRRLREASPKTHIWVQTGSVTDALEIATTCQPDVLVCQGADAGGHGLENGAGVISLVPEISDALSAQRHGSIPLVAAGGIADGRGVAASVALGAVGAAMGTRFLASREVKLSVEGYQAAILAAKDGGQATIRDKVFDDLNPKGNIWPGPYDGRAIRNLTWKDKRSGTSTEDNRKLQGEAAKEGDRASNLPDSRITVWAGTGVGLVTHVQSTAEIVEEVRGQARKVLESFK